MARWAMIAGPSCAERTAFAREVARALVSRGLRVGGFLQTRGEDALGRKTFELTRLSVPGRVALATDAVAPRGSAEEGFCSWAFRSDAFEEARRWMIEDARASDLLVVDEVSKLEVQGRGHHAALDHALAQPDPTLIVLCARADQVFWIVERFPLADDPVAWIELPADEEAKRRFVEALSPRSRDP